MKTVVYTGGTIRGYELEVGERLRFVSQREYPYMGMVVKLHVLHSMDTHRLVYVNTKELTECFEVIA